MAEITSSPPTSLGRFFALALIHLTKNFISIASRAAPKPDPAISHLINIEQRQSLRLFRIVRKNGWVNTRFGAVFPIALAIKKFYGVLGTRGYPSRQRYESIMRVPTCETDPSRLINSDSEPRLLRISCAIRKKEQTADP